MEWSTFLKWATIIFLAGGLYWRVLALETNVAHHEEEARIKTDSLVSVLRYQAVIIERVEALRFAVGRIEGKLDNMEKRRR